MCRRKRCAKTSCRIEIDICREPIGKQDQYAAAYGGFNVIEFHQDDSVVVTPIIMPRSARDALERQIIIFYTGITRNASQILKIQSDAIGSDAAKQRALLRMVELTYQLRNDLQLANINSFGGILDENWCLKKSLVDDISTSGIDDWYRLAKNAGAAGGKILGAGAGGFLMFFAPQSVHPAIERALHFLRRIPFRFEPLGSRVIFYDPTDQTEN